MLVLDKNSFFIVHPLIQNIMEKKIPPHCAPAAPTLSTDIMFLYGLDPFTAARDKVKMSLKSAIFGD